MERVDDAQVVSTLDELDELLDKERVALRTLDTEAIELATRAKVALDERMRELGKMRRFDVSHLERLNALRERAVHNQLLYAHARACVRGAIAAATGGEELTYRPPTQPPAGTTTNPVRVDVRG